MASVSNMVFVPAMLLFPKLISSTIADWLSNPKTFLANLSPMFVMMLPTGKLCFPSKVSKITKTFAEYLGSLCPCELDLR